MLEQVYDTLMGILFTELPKNNNSQPVLYDHPIKGWYFGDRTLITETPAILMDGGSTQGKITSFGVKTWEYTITISLWASQDNTAISARNLEEMARLVQEALLPHRRIWVLAPCPFNAANHKFFLTPEHFAIAHSAAMAPFIQDSEDEFSDIWYETHAQTSALPTLDSAGVAADAFNRLYEAVRNGDNVANLTSDGLATIQAYQRDLVRPIRLLYNVNVTDVKKTSKQNDQAFLNGAEFTLTAKENVRIATYGPNNVPTDAWS